MKKMLFFAVLPLFWGCAELQKIVNVSLPENAGISNLQIANGLKEALNNGVDKQVSKLTLTDGFYGNESVRIPLPKELKTVEQKLSSVGMGALTDQGIKLLNRAAEDAVKEATPIFIQAIKEMSFADVRKILMGHDSSATLYLNETTKSPLYNRFYPQVEKSLTKVGADKAWNAVTTKYNAIPFVTKVNPDLKDYVTNMALAGVFKMITREEKQIRNNLQSRTSDLLKQVFALQD